MSVEIQGGSIMALSPSFNSYSSTGFARIAAKVSEEFIDQREELGLEAPPPPDDDDDDDDEFEFAFSRDPSLSPISADEIFSNGQIRTIYPVFNRDLINNASNTATIRLPLRKLFIEDQSDELDGLAHGSYCVWTPSNSKPPQTCNKSNSTGSQSKRWRFRDILHRSNSDGAKDTYVFLSATSKKKDEKLEVVKEKKKIVVVAEKKVQLSAHELHYVRNRAVREGDKKKSYLPYRQDLVGFFANVNGFSRNLHPF
ncbi:hypothetical protein GIB67_022754 [Kingdonia uniflora]|uniref:Uncharacterized protein n=1 Tax=Kingdonia uniflora TaxID=39325 RepID=A0A7J7NET3_9MAGN|nr:hypothetical protein GIB67_022754 [Kingdonia uniflora]